MASKRITSKQKNKPDIKSQQKKEEEKNEAIEGLKKQFIAVLLFFSGILLFLLALIDGEQGWEKMHSILLGLFGLSSYVLGPLLIYAAIMNSFEKEVDNSTLRAVLIILLLLILCAAFQIFISGKPNTDGFVQLIETLFNQGKEKLGGGVMSLFFGIPLTLLGNPGDKIVVFILFFVLIMIITKSTIAGLLIGVKKPVDKVIEVSHNIAEYQQNKISQQKANIDIPIDDYLKKKKNAKNQEIDTETSRSQFFEALGVSDEKKQKRVSNPLNNLDDIIITPDEEDVENLDDIIKRKYINNNEEEQIAEEKPQRVKVNIDKEVSEVKSEIEAKENEVIQKEYILPPISLLRESKKASTADSAAELKANAQLLVDTLTSFGVATNIIDISRGPSVTRYELQPKAGVKISKITSLADDIALNLAATGVRIEAPIPGKAAVGIEVPNKAKDSVSLREIIASDSFQDADKLLTICLGKDISGEAITTDISKMPHLLIAGTTGSGKSVCINSLIMSLLFRANPDELKFLMIDPKMVELNKYNGLPHLAVPVVSDPKKAAGALGWAVAEMLKRYQLFAGEGARDLETYNKSVENNPDKPQLPHYVIIIDELSDLMLAAPNEVEDSIMRLAQMARAAGMHLVIATQRPSVNVITGVIKANIPSRIAFAVSSQIDSRTILDSAGAEKLLGMGDMLFSPVGSTKPTRIQGCFVSDEEIDRVISFINNSAQAQYDSQIIADIEQHIPVGKGSSTTTYGQPSSQDDEDPMLMDCIEAVVEAGQASTSLLQRKCKLGYARAARIIDELEAKGIVSGFSGSKPRQVLISKERWMEMKLNRADMEDNSNSVPEEI